MSYRGIEFREEEEKTLQKESEEIGGKKSGDISGLLDQTNHIPPYLDVNLRFT